MYSLLAPASTLFQNMRLQSPHCSSGTISVPMASTFLSHMVFGSRGALLSLIASVVANADPAQSFALDPLALYFAGNRLFGFALPQTPFAWATHLRMDGLFAGAALGYLYHFR